MSNTVIRVEKLSKLYRLGEVSTGTISHDLNRWFAKLRGKDDPFSKVGTVNDRTKKSDSEYAWALRDVDFTFNQGDTVGIIGKNGAGKSTLLKLLSRVTAPTSGVIKLKGRIASLLEVGTGFHPELTGRENIYLNGAILGMTRAEIKRKFDEIVEFSGVERYIDTPVKRYSSGMYVRLAFGVAAHLESEILIVDEVLAVGDAEFQKKCLGKMGDISSKEGRTVFFVSHNMDAVQNLCSKSLLLKNGMLISNDKTSNVIDAYLSEATTSSSQYLNNNCDSTKITIQQIRLLNQYKNAITSTFNTGDSFIIEINFNKSINFEFWQNCQLIVECYNTIGKKIFAVSNKMGILTSKISSTETIFLNIPKLLLAESSYYLDFVLYYKNEEVEVLRNKIQFNIVGGDYFGTGAMPIAKWHGEMIVDHYYEV